MFTFNFLPNDEQQQEEEKATTESQVSENNQHTKPQPSQSDISHPFSWKENLETLLEERSQQEIVFQEIELLKSNNNNNNAEEVTSVECECEPLRRICMDHYQNQVTPGVYEGGLQVWECSLDLVRYFQDHPQHLRLKEDSSLLELGCGHALPSCWLLREALQQKRTVSVSLVDYNDYVIDDVTLSNVVLNTAGIVQAQQLGKQNLVSLGAGDWHDMSRQMEGRRFDWIIAAETTYTPEASTDTAELLLKHLTLETGVGWIASKRYYFGVGGGTDALREAAQKLSQTGDTTHFLKVETVRVFDNGVGNIREILKVTCHAKE